VSTECPNCGETVSQDFCSSCGQAARDRRGPLFSLLGEFFTTFFSLDGRHLRTAAALWVPGRLTQLFLEGKRASYVPPVRVYLLSSLVFFVLVGFPAPDADECNVYVGDVLVGREEPVPGLTDLKLETVDDSTRLGRWVGERLLPSHEHLQAMEPQELLDGFFGGMERVVPTTLIFFVPILALALKLLYVRQPFFYVDHLVFGLHFQSALFQAFVAAYVLNAVGLSKLLPPLLSYLVAFALIMTLYLSAALKRVYGQGWIRTLLKTAILGLLYLFLIQPIVAVTIILAVRSL
jgi:hypothetical protein